MNKDSELKKVSANEELKLLEYIELVLACQKSTQHTVACLKQDIRKIIHDEILSVLDGRQRRIWPI